MTDTVERLELMKGMTLFVLAKESYCEEIGIRYDWLIQIAKTTQLINKISHEFIRFNA